MIQYHQSSNMTEALLALPFIESIDQYYPDIKHWYVNTVVPGMITGDDILLLAKDNNQIAGICLAKKGEENKLRCIRVAERYRNQGIGVQLIDKSLELIGASKPLVTVSEELLHEYSRMFVVRYGFELTNVVRGMYRQRKLEYIFNEM